MNKNFVLLTFANLLIISYVLVDDGNWWFWIIVLCNVIIYKLLEGRKLVNGNLHNNI